jgi:hypothetical protein
MFAHAPQRPTQAGPASFRLEAAGRLPIPTIHLTGPQVVIGSEPACDLVLEYDGVAPRHCSIFNQSGELRLAAHSPMTWMNDAHVSDAVLRDGDLITIGPVQLRVVAAAAASDEHDDALPSRSESIFDDDPAPNEGRSANPHGDDSASAESHILCSNDTVILDRSRLELGHAFGSLVKHSAAGCENDAASPDSGHVEQAGAGSDLPRLQNELATERSRLHDQQKQLEHRWRLLDERETELRELYADVSARHTQMLQQQQHWEVLCKSPAVTESIRENEHAERRARAARQLAEQQDMLEALRRELHLRDNTIRDARRRIGELEGMLDQQSARLETLQQREELLERGEQELNMLSLMLDRESQALAVQRDELSAAAQREALRPSENDERLERERESLRQEREQLLEETGRQRKELEELAARLAERDRQLTHAEFLLSGRVDALDQREQTLDRHEGELTERLHTITQLHRDVDGRSRELESLRCALTIEQQEVHQLQQLLKEREARAASEEAELAQRYEELHVREESLLNRQVQLQNQQSDLEQMQFALSLRNSELSSRCEQIEARENELAELKRLALEEQRSRETSLQQREDELAADREELDRFRQQLEADRAAAVSESEHVRMRREELEAERASRERDLSQWREQLDLQSAALEQRAQELSQRCDELQAGEEMLQSRALELQNRQSDLEQTQSALALRNLELTSRCEQIEARESELAELKRLALDDQTSRETSFQQREEELAADREELDRLRRQLEADRTSREQELAQWREQLDLQSAALRQREQQLAEQQNDFDQRAAAAAEVDGAPASTDDDSQAWEQRRLELELWQQRLALVEEALSSRSRELDAAEERMEQQCRQLDYPAPAPSPASFDHPVADTGLQSAPSEAWSGQASGSVLAAEVSTEPSALSIADNAPAADPLESPSAEPNQEPSQVWSLRHQLAELFGIQSRTAESHPKNHAETEHEAAPAPSEPSEAPAPAEEEADPFASYQNAQVETETHEPPPAVQGSRVEPAMHSLKNAPGVVLNVLDGDRRTQLNEDERDAMRAHLSSLRAVANQSARSAVAKHVSRQMTVQYHVKGVITLISGVVCIVMLTSPFWSNVRYIEQGIGALVITCIMGTLLWFDYRKLLAAAESAVAKNPEMDAESPVGETGTSAMGDALSEPEYGGDENEPAESNVQPLEAADDSAMSDAGSLRPSDETKTAVAGSSLLTSLFARRETC